MGDVMERWVLLALTAPLALWVAIFWPDLCVIAILTGILAQDDWRYQA